MKLFALAIILCALLFPISCRDGRSKDQRIVGGVQVGIETVPYIVSLQFIDIHICGGSIISCNYVISAAHCTYRFDATVLSVRAGSSSSASGGSTHNVSEYFDHPQFDPILLDYDVTILRLRNWIVFDNTRRPIKLPFFLEPVLLGYHVSTSGWGETQNDNETNAIVRYVELRVTSQIECNRAYQSDGGITSRMFCAAAAGKDSCGGDSGGPLQDLRTRKLIGVVSFGSADGCAIKGTPGVYTRLSVLRPWIRSVVNF